MHDKLQTISFKILGIKLIGAITTNLNRFKNVFCF